MERERLLHGNWKIRPAAGLYFRRGWVEVVEAAPAGLRVVRGWDLAATEQRPGTDPDWTCGTKIGVTQAGRYYVLDHVYDRMAPHGVRQLMRNTATQDGHAVQQEIPQDPAQAGKDQRYNLSTLLDGFNVRFRPVSGDKITRFSPFSAQCEAGNVAVVRGPWNERWFRELENFPPGSHGHDDDADSTATAYHGLTARRPVAATATYGMR